MQYSINYSLHVIHYTPVNLFYKWRLNFLIPSLYLPLRPTTLPNLITAIPTIPRMK